jgi:16S rRNA (uracil1498-N3)-methyltransferase
LGIFLSECGDAPALRSALRNQAATQSVLAIGPEGGWTDEERDAALKGGFHEASLGMLILRTETAVIAALAALTYALGD